MPFCPECGKENPDQARYCQYCGQVFPETSPPPPPGSGPQTAGSPPGPGPRPQAGPPPGGQYQQTAGPSPSVTYGAAQPNRAGVVQMKNPALGALLGFINFGLGAFYNRQNAKGVVLLIVTLLFGGATWLLSPLLGLILGGVFAYDGYKISQRINNGETVGPWQFF